MKEHVYLGLDSHLVDTRVAPAVTRPRNSRSTIQNELSAQIYIVAGAASRDLDTVREGGEGGEGPARPAVLGNVLVEGVGQAAAAVLVVPVPHFRQFFVGDVAGMARNVVIRSDGFERRPKEHAETDNAKEKLLTCAEEG